MIVFLPLLWIMLALRTGHWANFVVISGSMEPTLLIGDRVLMFGVKDYAPRRGDVVALEHPEREGEVLAKRVIAIPGDVVEVRGGFLFVNGTERVEPYVLPENTRINVRDMRQTIEAGYLFVLGDNRNFSFDSLNFGPAPIRNVRGILRAIYWPINRIGAIQ